MAFRNIPFQTMATVKKQTKWRAPTLRSTSSLTPPAIQMQTSSPNCVHRKAQTICDQGPRTVVQSSWHTKLTIISPLRFWRACSPADVFSGFRLPGLRKNNRLLLDASKHVRFSVATRKKSHVLLSAPCCPPEASVCMVPAVLSTLSLAFSPNAS